MPHPEGIEGRDGIIEAAERCTSGYTIEGTFNSYLDPLQACRSAESGEAKIRHIKADLRLVFGSENVWPRSVATESPEQQ
jgi:hypothetical protein